MYDTLREISFYVTYFWVLLVVSYGFRDPNAYLLQENLSRTMGDSSFKDVSFIIQGYSLTWGVKYCVTIYMYHISLSQKQNKNCICIIIYKYANENIHVL